jgi:hypothetical protein
MRWHPYQISVRHELNENDSLRRRNFCRWFSNEQRNPRFLANLVIGDEAVVCMNGEVNSHNVRQYMQQEVIRQTLILTGAVKDER